MAKISAIVKMVMKMAKENGGNKIVVCGAGVMAGWRLAIWRNNGYQLM
jgi:hypothetical protein